MTNDPIPRMSGDKAARALFERISGVCDGQQADTVLSVCVNMVANVVRQCSGTRDEAYRRMTEVMGRGMSMLMEHYDPVTGKRRSVVPFTQVVTPITTVGEARFFGLGKGNGRSS